VWGAPDILGGGEVEKEDEEEVGKID